MNLGLTRQELGNSFHDVKLQHFIRYTLYNYTTVIYTNYKKHITSVLNYLLLVVV